MNHNVVNIKTEKELAEITAEFIHISLNMRYWQKYWSEHYGAQPLNQKKRWEARMDAFLLKLGVTDHMKTNAIHIMVNGEEYRHG